MTTERQKTKFTPVPSSVNYPAMEERVMDRWASNNIFERTMSERADGPRYVFFEGPPTANGRPGIHHVLARAFKDMFPRYKIMQGHYVLRKGGWDTHGLPVEIEVEKQLGLSGKQQIDAYGVEEFNRRCRASAMEYIKEWERVTDRMGFWVDKEDAYVTFRPDYVESIWWILRQFWDKDLLYQGYKVVPYCPRCGTPLSSHELSLGYKDGTVDPSVYVKFKIRSPLSSSGGKDEDRENEYLLAWTTTPWTLPGNVALAVGEKISYVKVKDVSGDILYLAAARAEAALKPGYAVLETLSARDLLGLHYEPLYQFYPVEQDYAYVVTGDDVNTEDGTGIVHIAPAFGVADMAVGRANKLPLIMTIDGAGKFKPEVTWAGLFVKDADPLIEQELASRGLLYRTGTMEHTYPFCWRCDTPLLYLAKRTWYIRTSEHKDKLVALNQEINWVPEHIKNGRFGAWLENNVDWALGRDRYWGTPLPVWKSDAPDSTYMECVGSREELSQKTGRDLSDLDLHRPYVDNVTWPAPDGGTMRRVPEVIDVWFDSGAMPLAQHHYPFENQALWAEQQQADYICEAVDQTRGWFYSLHAISTLLFDRPAYKNVICLGHILAEDGSKMSKSKGNVVNPWEVFNVHGADATRWNMYTASPPGNSRRFSVNLVGETVRKFMNTLWNTYSFFVTYANLSGEWQAFDELSRAVASGNGSLPDPGRVGEGSLLDRWVLSELNKLIRDVTAAYESYDVLGATRPVAEFVDSVSNWYVRLSRRRFWEGDPVALGVLYEVLVKVSQLLAPATPFIAEELYQNLVTNGNPAAASVHLSRWPAANAVLIDEQLSEDMALAQKVTSLGHAARQNANLKVRQPLAQVVVRTRNSEERASLERLSGLILDELNVKALTFAEAAGDLVDVVVFPFPKQLGQKYGKGYPVIRKLLGELDQLELAGKFQAGETVNLEGDGTTYAIAPEDVEVRSTPRAGFSVAQDGGYVVAITTTLTPELEQEGNARELVRRIQQLRKDAGLAISDRITLYVSDSPLTAGLLAAYGDYLKEETLTVELVRNGVPSDLPQASFELGASEVTVALRKK